MSINELFKIVKAQFACKTKPGNKLTAEAIEGNHLFPMIYFTGIAHANGHSVEEIATLTGETNTLTRQCLRDFSAIEMEDEITSGTRLGYKMVLIQNGIRLHEMGLRAERIYQQKQLKS